MLLAMGYDTLSMGAYSLAKAKYVIRQVTAAQAENLLERVLQLHTVKDVQQCVDEALREFGVSPMLRPSAVV